MPAKTSKSPRSDSGSSSKRRRTVVTTKRVIKRPSVRKIDPLVKTADVILAAGGRAMVFTGAGVSAESGVPTYRDPGGIWESFDQKQVGHITGFLSDPLMCWRFEFELWKLLVKVHPNPAHLVLAEMERRGFVKGVVTQNVDGLHQQAGSAEVHELHGNEMRGICLRKGCHKTFPATTVFQLLSWVDADLNIVEGNVPPCPRKDAKHLKGNAAARKDAQQDLKVATRQHKIASLLAAGKISKATADALTVKMAAKAKDPPSATPAAVSPKAPSDSGSGMEGDNSDDAGSSLELDSDSESTSSDTSLATATSLSSDVSQSSDDSSNVNYNDILELPARAAARQRAPRCPHCDGVIKPDAIYFGEPLDNSVKKAAYALSEASKVCIVVGSTCIVSPANKLPLIVKARGGNIIELNPNKTIMTGHATIKIDGKAGEVLPLVFTTICAIAAAQAAGVVTLAAAAVENPPQKKRRASALAALARIAADAKKKLI